MSEDVTQPKSRGRHHPLILEEYKRRRGPVDPALINDAQRVFEALLASCTVKQIEQALDASRFERTDEYGMTIKILHDIAHERA
jgi:hypothetical protein